MFMENVKRIDDDSAIYYAIQTLKYRVLPHIGILKDTFKQKAYFICYMAKKLLHAFLNKSLEDDRDHYGKKRV